MLCDNNPELTLCGTIQPKPKITSPCYLPVNCQEIKIDLEKTILPYFYLDRPLHGIYTVKQLQAMLKQSKNNIRRMLSQLHAEGKATYRGRGRYEINTGPEEIVQSSRRFYENRIIPRYAYIAVYFISPPLHGIYTYRQLREITHQTNANINRMLSQFYAEGKMKIILSIPFGMHPFENGKTEEIGWGFQSLLGCIVYRSH